MATISNMYSNWCLEELRGDTQVNQQVWLARFKKGLLIFQKMMLEYVSGKQNVQNIFADIVKGQSTYSELPFNVSGIPDFYSIIQLRVAYRKTDKYTSVPKYSPYDSGATYYKHTRRGYVVDENPEHADLLTRNYYVKEGTQYVLVREHTAYNAGTTYYDRVSFDTYEVVTAEHADLLTKGYYLLAEEGYPVYKICKPINLGDYNINPGVNRPEDGDEIKERGGVQRGGPMVWDRISEEFPRYTFIDKNTIRIYPTPVQDVENGISLNYNYMPDIDSLQMNTDVSTLNLPRYFFDAIDDYITFRLYQAENPEMAQWYYQQFESTLHDNIYGLNKDKRPVDEGFADLRYFYHY